MESVHCFYVFMHIYVYMHVSRRDQEFERKQGQRTWEKLEEEKGMEGNDPGKEKSTPDALERQTSFPSSKAVCYVDGFVKNIDLICYCPIFSKK